MTLDELGEGLLLLAVRGNGMLAVRDKLRFGMAGSELIRLAAARRKALGLVPVTRWTITDTARLAAARASLDIIASGTGSIGVEQAALAGPADAIGLTGLIYPGFAGASARRQVRNAARRDRSADAVASAVRDLSLIHISEPTRLGMISYA